MDDHSLDISSTAQEFYSYLNNYISKKVGDPHIAKDLTQEVMYRLAKADDEDRKIQNVKAWLFQTTRHVVADYYRDKNKNPVNDIRSNFSTNSTTLEAPPLSEVDFIITMIKLLPDKYSRPLLMSDIKELPQKEIAEKLNIGLSATKMRIKRAREKLHELFTICCDIEFSSNGDFVSCTVKDHCEPLQKFREELCQENRC
ncbi:MAG: sigma-70 family RNA polymerase sigma factor [Gracilimonas sp.]|nr:sigma-70 family RNA polymerase sigma factor [Gracilimonas sp.]